MPPFHRYDDPDRFGILDYYGFRNARSSQRLAYTSTQQSCCGGMRRSGFVDPHGSLYTHMFSHQNGETRSAGYSPHTRAPHATVSEEGYGCSAYEEFSKPCRYCRGDLAEAPAGSCTSDASDDLKCLPRPDNVINARHYNCFHNLSTSFQKSSRYSAPDYHYPYQVHDSDQPFAVRQPWTSPAHRKQKPSTHMGTVLGPEGRADQHLEEVPGFPFPLTHLNDFRDPKVKQPASVSVERDLRLPPTRPSNTLPPLDQRCETIVGGTSKASPEILEPAFTRDQGCKGSGGSAYVLSPNSGCEYSPPEKPRSGASTPYGRPAARQDDVFSESASHTRNPEPRRWWRPSAYSSSKLKRESHGPLAIHMWAIRRQLRRLRGAWDEVRTEWDLLRREQAAVRQEKFELGAAWRTLHHRRKREIYDYYPLYTSGFQTRSTYENDNGGFVRTSATVSPYTSEE